MKQLWTYQKVIENRFDRSFSIDDHTIESTVWRVRAPARARMEQFISSVHLASHFKIAGKGVFSYTVQQLDVQPVSACDL
jgi:hypothetical protein